MTEDFRHARDSGRIFQGLRAHLSGVKCAKFEQSGAAELTLNSFPHRNVKMSFHAERK